MIEFDEDRIAQAVAGRSAEQKWRPAQTLIVSSICAWYAAHPDVAVKYENGRPGEGMQEMLDNVSHDTGIAADEVLTSFGAAHCLLCDVVPGFRPVLFSAWDRNVEGHRHE